MKPDEALPAVRPLDVIPFRNEQNEMCFALHDQSQLSPQSIAISLPGYFVLAHLDGQHTCQDIQHAFLKQFGQTIAADQVEALVSALNSVLMLQNGAFERAYADRRGEYLAAETRDNCERWPAEAELRGEIEQMVASGSPYDMSALHGVIAPHLDYQRGGPCYADAYATLAQHPADRYVILGTNHAGRSRSAVATTKDFQTPLGRVATDRAFIRNLESRLGLSLCDHEFDHHFEHSIELQVHVLQVIQPDRPFEIVPVLCPDPCGPTGTRPIDGTGPDLGDFADALAELLAGDAQSTVVVAGADLSHVGQRFGDPEATTPEFLAEVERSDRAALELAVSGEQELFIDAVRTAGNETRICSVGCIYAMLRALDGPSGHLLRYHQAVNMEAETHVTCAAAVFGE